MNETAETQIFYATLLDAGMPRPQAEYEFCPGRKWRADYCWPDLMLILEVEGGIVSGRPCPMCKRPPARGHTSVSGIRRDIEKYNAAARLGFHVIRVEPAHLCRDETLRLIADCIAVHTHHD